MSDEKALIYTRKFTVGGHDVNAEKFLTIPSLLKNMQECSLKHAMQLKTSVWDMAEEQISWVLIRKELSIIEPLRMEDEYTIITYPSGFEKFFAYRDWLVFDNDKKLVAAASSTWTMFSTESRKLVKIPNKIIEIGTPDNLKFLSQPDKKVGFSKSSTRVDVRKVRAYDLDWNNHVNNIVLSRFLLEPLKELSIEDHDIKKVLFHFKNEANLGDLLEVNLDDSDNNIAILRREDSEDIIAISKVSMRKEKL